MRVYIFTLLLSLCLVNTTMAQSVNLGDFEDQAANSWSAWSPATAEVVANPVPDDYNSSAYVMKFDQTAGAWKGLSRWNDPPVINSTILKISLDVFFVDNGGLIQLYLGNSVSGLPNNTSKQITGIEPNSWTSIEFDLSDIEVLDYKQLAFQSDVQGVIYVDNITLIEKEVEPDPEVDPDPIVDTDTIVEPMASNGRTVFNPATVDSTALPEGMSIVEIDGKKYCQIILNGWSSSFPVDSFEVKANHTHMRVAAKFSGGVSGFDAAKVNTFLKLANADFTEEFAVNGYASTAEFTKFFVPIKKTGIVGNVQVAGQETTSWSAIKGDTLWIGKIDVIEVDPDAVFDPYTVDEETLPDGWSIVELNGQKFAQIILNGWSTSIPVDAYTIPAAKTHFRAVTKYSGGVSGFDQTKINTFLKLANADFSEEIAVSGVASTSTLTAKFVQLKTKGIVGNLQVAGQETTGWSAVKGDTLWVGKVRVVAEDKTAIANPATYDAKELPAGWEIVTIDNTKYFKVGLKGWGNVLPVDEFTFPAGSTDFNASIKYETGTSGFELSKVNTFFKIANIVGETWTEIGASGAPSSSTFKNYKVAIKDSKLKATVVQVAGQETTSWSAVTGDFMYIGKITTNAAAPADPNIVIDPATYEGALGTGWEIVTLDGKKYFKVKVNGWSTYMNIPEYTFPAGTTGFKASVKLEKGNPDYDVADINVFMKFSTSGWTEIAAGSGAGSDKFTNYMINVADPSMKAGVLQVATQEDVSGGGTALVGDVMYIGQIVAVKATPVTFIIDDSVEKTYEGFMLKGSWLKASGEYDKDWNGGVEHTSLYDDGTHGDAVAADNIWTIKLFMVSDAGKNTWEWGFNDLEENWIPTKNTQFKVADDKAFTTTYVITDGVGVKDFNSNWNIYPNPAKDQINIQGLTVKSVAVFNLTGSKVMESNKNTINISSLNKGVYLVKVTDIDGKVAVRKLNKN